MCELSSLFLCTTYILVSWDSKVSAVIRLWTE
jgi:hypothetical protein